MEKISSLPSTPEKQELNDRIQALYQRVKQYSSDWDAIFILDKVNQYYFTGTMQDGVFVLKQDGSWAYFVRRSFERAQSECPLEAVYPIGSYGDIKKHLGENIHKVFLETEVVTYGILQRLKKHFAFEEIFSVDRLVAGIRAVKSRYELACMMEAGRQHAYLLETIVPGLLHENLSEAEFTGSLFTEMVKLGYQGLARFAMFQTEVVVGQVGFGENSLYPTSFDGPGGMKGLYPAAPLLGDRTRTLKKGDLVFLDLGYGVHGYHTDRTQIYMFGANPPAELVTVHRQCKEILQTAAAMLKPGNIPSEIYSTIINSLEPEFLQNFMGYENRAAKFLGHGVGLQVDESPVISKGFDDPLVENMVFAIEPKKGMKGFGIVGVEDTYIVTKTGGKCITGGEKDIIVV